MAFSDQYKVQITSGITNGAWTAITAHKSGTKIMAKLADASAWTLATDSDGNEQYAILSEFCDEIHPIFAGDVLFWVRSSAAGPLDFQVFIR